MLVFLNSTRDEEKAGFLFYTYKEKGINEIDMNNERK